MHTSAYDSLQKRVGSNSDTDGDVWGQKSIEVRALRRIFLLTLLFSDILSDLTRYVK